MRLASLFLLATFGTSEGVQSLAPVDSPDRAVEYLDIAISGNPTMPRLHALRSRCCAMCSAMTMSA